MPKSPKLNIKKNSTYTRLTKPKQTNFWTTKLIFNPIHITFDTLTTLKTRINWQNNFIFIVHLLIHRINHNHPPTTKKICSKFKQFVIDLVSVIVKCCALKKFHQGRNSDCGYTKTKTWNKVIILTYIYNEFNPEPWKQE